MKVRQGFVSNSSSSSFLFVGWELPQEPKSQLLDRFVSPEKLDIASQKEYKKPWSELNEDERTEVYYCSLEDTINILDSEEQGAPNGKCLVGKVLTTSDDCGNWDEDNWSLAELQGEVSHIGLEPSKITIRLGSMLT